MSHFLENGSVLPLREACQQGVNFENIQQPYSRVSTANFEHATAGWNIT